MPGAQLFLQNRQDIRIGGRQSNAQYQYTLQTPELALLAEWGPRVTGAACALPATCRCQFRPAEFRTVVERVDRPRHGLASGTDGAGSGQRALRRLRPAPGLDDVQVDQPVSRGAGAAAAVVAESRIFWKRFTSRRPRAFRCRSRRSPTSRKASRRSRCRIRGSSRRPRFRSICRKACRSAMPSRQSTKRKSIWACPPIITGKFAGTAQAFQDSLGRPADPDRHGDACRLHHPRNSV